MSNVIKQIVRGEGDSQTIRYVVRDNERGPQGEKGDTGAAATIQAGEAYAVQPDAEAQVINSGTSQNAVFDFYIPKGEKGDKGEKGSSATIEAGNAYPIDPSEEPRVENTGTENDAVFDFYIPKGEKGDQGPQGDPGVDGAIQYQAGTGIAIDDDTHTISATGEAAATWGGISGEIADQTDLIEYIQNQKHIWYGTCESAGSATVQVIRTVAGDFRRQAGNAVFVAFSNAYIGDAETQFDVDDTGAVEVDNTEAGRWRAGEVLGFVYDGAKFRVLDNVMATTEDYGETKLYGGIDSNSDALAATAGAVKTAYDEAAGKQDVLVSGTNIRTLNGGSILGSGNISVNALIRTTENLSPAEDAPAGWYGVLGASGYFLTRYNTTGRFSNQPQQYGFLETLCNGTDIFQRWTSMPTGAAYWRSGNTSGWNSNNKGVFKRFLDEVNLGSYIKTINNNTLTGSGNVDVGTLTDVKLDNKSIVSNNIATIPTATSSAYGAVKLVNSVTSTDTSVAGTAAADRTAYLHGAWYGTCSTAAATVAKVVTCSNFVRQTGSFIIIRFTNANTAASPTINVNGTGAALAKALDGATAANWEAGDTISFVFNGSYWVMTSEHGLQKSFIEATKLSADKTVAANPTTAVAVQSITLPRGKWKIEWCVRFYAEGISGTMGASTVYLRKGAASSGDANNVQVMSVNSPADGNGLARNFIANKTVVTVDAASQAYSTGFVPQNRAIVSADTTYLMATRIS